MPRRTPQQQRARQSAIVSRAILVCFKEMRRAYHPKRRNVGRIFQELIVAMAVRLQVERKHAPTSIAAIARLTRLPYANVHRAIAMLRREHVITKRGAGYIGDGDYLMERMEARSFRRIVGAIVGAGDELRLVQKNA